MKIHNECSFISDKNIKRMEKKYGFKYVFESTIKNLDGKWIDQPVAIFYTETPHPRGSNYVGLIQSSEKKTYLLVDGVSATEPFFGLRIGDEVIYSRHTHDYREHQGFFVDGGREYTRHGGPTLGEVVRLCVNKDRLEVDTVD